MILLFSRLLFTGCCIPFPLFSFFYFRMFQVMERSFLCAGGLFLPFGLLK